MLDYRLDKHELAELRAAHRAARDVREAYRINAVILLGKGRAPADVADAVLIDPDTARDYFKRYKKGGLDGLLQMSYSGSRSSARRHAVGLDHNSAHLIPLTLFSPGVSAPFQNMGLRAQTHMGQPALGGFVILRSATSTRKPNWNPVNTRLQRFKRHSLRSTKISKKTTLNVM